MTRLRISGWRPGAEFAQMPEAKFGRTFSMLVPERQWAFGPDCVVLLTHTANRGCYTLCSICVQSVILDLAGQRPVLTSTDESRRVSRVRLIAHKLEVNGFPANMTLLAEIPARPQSISEKEFISFALTHGLFRVRHMWG
jgi:hypothetical protein